MADDEDFDINLSPLWTEEQDESEAKLFNDFKNKRPVLYRNHLVELKALPKQRKFDISDPRVFQMNLNLPGRHPPG